jgi:hypothetical protein
VLFQVEGRYLDMEILFFVFEFLELVNEFRGFLNCDVFENGGDVGNGGTKESIKSGIGGKRVCFFGDESEEVVWGAIESEAELFNIFHFDSFKSS